MQFLFVGKDFGFFTPLNYVQNDNEKTLNQYRL